MARLVPLALSIGRVLICLFFNLQRKMENFVSICDHIPLAKVSLEPLVLIASTIVPRFWFSLPIFQIVKFHTLQSRHWLMRASESMIFSIGPSQW